MPSLTWTPQRSFRGISVRSNWGRWKQLAGSPGPGKILTLDPRGSLSLLRTGYRQPARYFGYTRCINRWNDRVSSCHDRCAANGEMDRGRYRRRRYRRPHTGVDWNAQGSLDRFDGRFREPHHRDCGARRALLISFLALVAPAAAIALVMLFLLVAIRLLRRLFGGTKSSDSRT